MYVFENYVNKVIRAEEYNAWILFLKALGMPAFFKMVSPHLKPDLALNVFEVLSETENGFVPRSVPDDLEDTFGTVSEKGKMAAEKRQRSNSVYGALIYLTYLHMELVNSALANNTRHTELTNCYNLVIYILQSTKLSKVIKSQPDFIVAALRTMNPDPLVKNVEVLQNKENL